MSSLSVRRPASAAVDGPTRGISEGIKMARQRLVRRQDEKMIAGVCAGLAEYYNTSVTRLRWAFVIFGLFGAGEIVYILLWMLLPKEQ